MTHSPATKAEPAEIMDAGCVTVSEACQFTGLGRTVLYQQMTAGKLPYTKIGSRRLIPRKSLQDLLAANLVNH